MLTTYSIPNRFNSAKDCPIERCFYDIEVMPHNFSIVFLIPDRKRGTVITLDDNPTLYDYPSMDRHLKERWQTEYPHLRCFHYSCKSNGKERNLFTDKAYAPIRQMMQIFCQTEIGIECANPHIYEFYGWNSDNYDLPIIVYLYTYMETMDDFPEAHLLRRLSDGIIEEQNRSFYRLAEWVARERLFGRETERINQKAKDTFKRCIEHQNHIDIGAINEKSKDVKTGSQFMFPLKTIASYCGLDIVEDETTRLDFHNWDYDALEDRFKANVTRNKELRNDALEEMLYYNINDVHVTYKISEEREYGGTLEVKDGLRRNYPFLLKPDEKHRILGRSATMAQLAGKIIRGENRNVLRDDPVVDLTYPFADGSKKNLLDYVATHEHVHPLMIAFYRQFDQHDMHSRDAHYYTLSHSITRTAGGSGTTCNIPYMDKNGKALNTYITLSIGGAHGGIALGFSNHGNKYSNVFQKDMNHVPYHEVDETKEEQLQRSFSEYAQYREEHHKEGAILLPLCFDYQGKSYMERDGRWEVLDENERHALNRDEYDIVSFSDAQLWQRGEWKQDDWMFDFATGSIETGTIDVDNVIHADFASYYPSMNIRLGVYVGEDKIDNYKQVRDARIKVKESIPSDLNLWTEDDFEKENTQLGMKLTINSATGASNQHKDNVDLPLDNCTTRMRIMGNILIYVLAQRFADAGGFVFSTNTDGLYLTGVSQEESKAICDDFMATYGLSIEPEPLARMINKSANERIEYEHPTVPNRVGGNLGRSTGKRIPLDSNIDYPRACGKAVLDYMSNRRDWLDTPISVRAMRDYLEHYLEDDVFVPLDWTVTLKGNRNRKFKIQTDEEDRTGYGLAYKEIPLSDTNRIAMIKGGQEIVQYFKGKKDTDFKATKIPKITSTSITILNTKASLDALDPKTLNVDAYLEWCINLLNVWYVPKTIPEIEPERQSVYEQMDLFADL